MFTWSIALRYVYPPQQGYFEEGRRLPRVDRAQWLSRCLAPVPVSASNGEPLHTVCIAAASHSHGVTLGSDEKACEHVGI